MPLIERTNNLLEKTVLTPEQYGILTTADAVYCTSKYPDLATLDAVVGSNPCTLIVDSAVTISANTTIGTGGILEGAKVQVYGTGSFAVATGKTLTIVAPFSAGAFQVFSGAGSVVFGAESIRLYEPKWFSSKTIASDAALFKGAGFSLLDTVNGKTYKITMANGLLTPVEV